ncbi:MAG: formate hydrogenlyase transcriptional activator [Acidobacteriaceae bacterium]|nr:formate hydrogenlyase transcriptional activator [Acidobacteriaceae bacterium]
MIVSDILSESIWDDYRDRVLPYGIRAVWSRPLLSSEGKVIGTFAILYREVRQPGPADLQLIENAGHIAGIAIERHIHEERLRLERDRLRLLLEITNSMSSKLDLRRLVETLSTDLLRVTRCDFCALLLPDSDSSELRITTLYTRIREALCATARSYRSMARSAGRPFGLASFNTSTALRKYATTPKVSATA